MADESNNGGSADATTATTETTVATPAAATTTVPAVEAAPSKEDWAGLAKSLRTIAAALPQVVKPAEAPKQVVKSDAAGDASTALAEIASLRFEIGLRDAMSAAGITTGPVAELITKAAKADKPTDLTEYVAKYAGLGRVASAPVAPIVPPVAPSNSGAPKGPGSDTVSGDPRHWPEDVVKKMSVENFRKAVAEFEATAGGKQNPFARLRKR